MFTFFGRGLLLILSFAGYAKYLYERDTEKYHAFFMCVCERDSRIGTKKNIKKTTICLLIRKRTLN
jgi:hypothetical protein